MTQTWAPDTEANTGQRGHWLNAERVRAYSWIIVGIFAIVLAVWTIRSLPDLVDPRGKPLGYDFMAYWSTARLALAGHAADAFDWQAIVPVQHAAVPFRAEYWFPWHYPPTFLLAVAPLGLMPYPVALAVFLSATGALYAALIPRLIPDRRFWIAAAAPAALLNLLDGQNAFLTVALAGFALLWLERWPVAAGVLVGLLALKPHLAPLFPVALLAGGHWRAIAAAAVTVATLVFASLAAFGWVSWLAFLAHLPVSQAMADAGAVPWDTMPSPYVFVLSLGGPVAAARVAQAIVAVFAAGCVWSVWRRRAAPFEARTASLMTGSLLVSPYLFYYDLLWLVPAVAWLALLGLRSGFRRGEREVLLFAWSVPAIMQPVQMLTHVQLGFPAVLLLLLLAVCRASSFTDSSVLSTQHSNG